MYTLTPKAATVKAKQTAIPNTATKKIKYNHLKTLNESKRR